MDQWTSEKDEIWTMVQSFGPVHLSMNLRSEVFELAAFPKHLTLSNFDSFLVVHNNNEMLLIYVITHRGAQISSHEG